MCSHVQVPLTDFSKSVAKSNTIDPFELISWSDWIESHEKSLARSDVVEFGIVSRLTNGKDLGVFY